MATLPYGGDPGKQQKAQTTWHPWLFPGKRVLAADTAVSPVITHLFLIGEPLLMY